MLGQTVHQYQITEEIGYGGMGIVYKARDTKLNRTVALKFLPADLTRDTDAKARFIQEARAASALDHDNICTIHDFDETDDGQLFIDMAYYEGTTLAERLSGQPMAEAEALDITLKIASGLRKAHEHGIVHRDIKPANIFLTNDGRVKILDFGLAKLIGQSHLSQVHSTLGTVAYMSPEQARGENIDHRSDIWSLGIVLYEMLTARSPFAAEYDQATIYAILSEQAAPLNETRPEISAQTQNVVTNALQKAEAHRYQSMSELISALDPQAAKAPESETSDIDGSGHSFKRMQWRLIAVSAVIVAALMVYIISPTSHSDALVHKSIAVLPFDNMSAGDESSYFSDGVTEDIQSQVGKISALRVISSLATRKYRNSDIRPRRIGRELQVTSILRGSVRRSDDRLRIFCELIDANSESQIWSETFDREVGDVFAVQSDVAQRIAVSLQAQLLPEEKTRIETRPTRSLKAYDLFLKGQEAITRYTKEDNEQAIEYFKQAIGFDSTFARAWAGLANAYVGRFSRYGYEHAWVDSAAQISAHAIRLDPNSAEAHAAAGIAYAKLGMIENSTSAYLRALECNPNYLVAASNLGTSYKNLGRYDLGLRWQKKTDMLYPTAYVTKINIGVIYSYFEEYSTAQEWFEKALRLRPKSKQVYNALAHSYLIQKRYPEAIALLDSMRLHADESWLVWDWMADIARHIRSFEQAAEFHRKACEGNPSGGNDWYSFSRIGLAYIHLRNGNGEAADSLLDNARRLRIEQIDAGVTDPWLFYDLAVIHAIHGDAVQTCEWLRNAVEHGWRDQAFARLDPWFERVINESGVTAIFDDVAQNLQAMKQRTQNMGW